MLPTDGLCLNASKTASSPLNITISCVHTLVIHPWQVHASVHEYGLIGCRRRHRSTSPSPVNTTHAGRVHQTVCKRLSLWVGVLYSCEQLNTASGWDSSLWSESLFALTNAIVSYQRKRLLLSVSVFVTCNIFIFIFTRHTGGLIFFKDRVEYCFAFCVCIFGLFRPFRQVFSPFFATCSILLLHSVYIRRMTLFVRLR